jgi:aspartate-semialdehyde dehydrogenase
MTKQVLTGLVGWRGMVGSVLLERMRAEGDFALIEPVFFSTSNAGGPAPTEAKNETKLFDAYDIAALKRCEIVITAQGSDYTKKIYPELRAAAGKATGSMRRRRCACRATRSSSSTRST